MRSTRPLFLTLLLLAAAGGAAAQTYDLRGPAPRPGTILQSRVDFKAPDGVFTIEENGETVRASSAHQGVSVTETEVLQATGKEVSLLRQRIAEDWWQSTFEREGFAPQKDTRDGPLAGETLLIEKRGGVWHKTMLGREPDKIQSARLREPYSDDNEIYPDRPVAVGDSWVLEGAKLATVMGFANALSTDGKATFTLDRVVTQGGERRAIISYRLELKARMLDDDQVPFEYSFGGSGEIQRSLTSYIDLSNRLSGQKIYAVTLTEGGRRSSRTDAGPFERTESQRLISESSRAEIVRRGSDSSRPAPRETRPAASQTGPAAAGGRSCKGTAVACSQRSEFNCALGSGCFAAGSCTGVPSQSCFGKDQLSCASTSGCFWQSWTKTCGGVLTCAGKTSFVCKTTPGCSWRSHCFGTAKPCASLDPALCSLQPGCSSQ